MDPIVWVWHKKSHNSAIGTLMKMRSMRGSVWMETTPPPVLAREIGLTNFHGAGDGGKEGRAAARLSSPSLNVWFREFGYER